MKRTVLAVIIALLVTAGNFSYEVAREELDSAQDRHIRFVNYVGPHSKIESLELIRGIGVWLGERIDGVPGEPNYFGKYRVLHAVGPQERGFLDADIFSVLSTAEVDHIDNLRHMLAGFLEGAYGYSPDDADLLAEFITVYNAVYRGQMEYFTSQYKNIVTGHLEPRKVGLSNIYSDWPGASQILIPLTEEAGSGSLSSLDSSELSDEKVIEDLRTREDKGVELRKDLVDLKEREVAQAEEQIEQDTEKLIEEKQEIQEERREVVEQLREVDEEKAVVLTAPDSPRKQKTLRELELQEEALRKLDDELMTREQDVQRKAADLEVASVRLDQKREEIRQDRSEIAKDQQELLDEDKRKAEAAGDGSVDGGASAAADSSNRVPVVPAAAIAQKRNENEGVYFVQVLREEEATYGQIVLLDSRSGARKKLSELNSVRGRMYERIGSNLLVIAGREDRGGAVRMHLLDGDTLEVQAVGREDIFPMSILHIRDNGFYAVTNHNDSWYLGMFGLDLKLKRRTEVPVNPYTAVTSFGNILFLQGRGDEVFPVDADSLKVIEK